MPNATEPIAVIDRAATGRRTLAVVGGYALTVGWFHYVDVYHNDFSSSGLLILITNLFRLLFVWYFFWIIQAAGAALLRLVGGAQPPTLSKTAYLVLTFAAGTGVWHLMLLLIGFLQLLYLPILLLATVPFVVLSVPEIKLTITELFLAIRRSARTSRAIPIIFFLSGCCWFLLFIGRGLYPGGGQDYFIHYFPSYRLIVDNHSLWPNSIWWNYLNTKGAGLIYMAMLLTDALAPSLVVFCFVSVAGLTVFVFVRRLAPSTHWPVVSMLLFFAIYVYTPNWGEFGKLHQLNTFFVVAILWLTVVALDKKTEEKRSWFLAIASAVLAAIVATPEIGPILGAVFAVLVLYHGARRQRERALACLALGGWAGALLAGMLSLNLATVGLPHDLGFALWWRWTNVEKLYRWGALSSFLWMDHWYARSFFGALRGDLGNAHNVLRQLSNALRLYLLSPLLLSGVAVASITVWRRSRAHRPDLRESTDALIVLFVPIATICVLSPTAGGIVAGSFVETSSFIVPVIIVAGIALWVRGLQPTGGGRLAAGVRHPGSALGVLIACAMLIAIKAPLDREFLRTEADAARYALGIFSIDEAYAHHHGEVLADSYAHIDGNKLAGKWGGIYPGTRGAYAVVGPHTPIWTLSVAAYCMLPDCDMRAFPNFIMVRDWDRLMWGTPEEGRQLLQDAGLNYFLVSNELPISDPLPLSALFAPDNIGRYLGIRWTDGITSLLTWVGPETTPIDADWIAAYRRAIGFRLSAPAHFPTAAVKAVFDNLRASPHPWQPFVPEWRKH